MSKILFKFMKLMNTEISDRDAVLMVVVSTYITIFLRGFFK